jgi:hypothetical protein
VKTEHGAQRESSEKVPHTKLHSPDPVEFPIPDLSRLVMEAPAIEHQLVQLSKIAPFDAPSGNVSRESFQSLPASSSPDGLPEDLLSVDQVSQMMREHDADLLERMHVDASRVSQYSSGRTPDLRPREANFPRTEELLALSPLSPRSQPVETSLPGTDNHEHDVVVVSKILSTDGATFGEYPSQLTPPMLSRSSVHFSPTCGRGTLGVVSEETVNTSWDGLIEPPEEAVNLASARYRRLLSGEIRTLDATEAVAPRRQQGERIEPLPVSVAHEAVQQEQQKKETGLAEARRFREAIQFAEAVGESIAMTRDEIRIIEDHTDPGETDDDDDDGCEPKEVVVDDQEIIADGMTSPQAALEMTNAHANQQDAQEGNKAAPLANPMDVSQRMTKRPVWPFGPAGAEHGRFLDTLSHDGNGPSFVYKGICANPPEITKRGIQRGNYAQLHRKAWLEVSDKYHRYGKNLRLYYRYWERLGFPTNQFFDWLDSKGDAAGQPLPNLEECPRSVLDSDTVLYISNPEVTEGYALDIICQEDGRARIRDVDARPVCTGIEGWIFVLRDGVMYGAEKITSISGHSKQRFHHSSFFGGKAVAAAGIIITDDQGYMTRLYPHSGHYRPGEAHMQRMLFFLHHKGVDLRTIEMDTQQFRHVSRDKEGNKSKDAEKEKDKGNKDAKDGEKKVKKIDSLHMEKAVTVACFLAHKASFIGQGIFDSIHMIRKADATSVSEALDLVDDGGYWPRSRHTLTLVGRTDNQERSASGA